MAVLVILLVSLLFFRGLGFWGIWGENSWVSAVRCALAVMLLFTASAHFTSRKEGLIAIVPPWVPRPRVVIFVTGLLEIAGAAGLLIDPLRRLAGICLILLFVALFPANVRAARLAGQLEGAPTTPLWLRAPMQVLFIALTWWGTQ